MTSFSDLGLSAPLIKALEQEGYATPTPIQIQAIPPVRTGADLLGIAQTGTGKTAAFALPILDRLLADRRPAMRKGCRVLVLSPTRELATQIAESFRTYGREIGRDGGTRLSVAVVFGGVAHRPQVTALARGVDVLVATPGRLLDHMGERNIVLEGTEILVLDEADQMLDLGFVKPIRQIVSRLSQRRQSLFFSATMPAEIGRLADEMLKSPVKVSVAPTATTVERVSQRVIHVEQTRKRALLVELLADPAMSRTLVFTRTKRGADRVARHLEVAGISAAAIHGNKSQRQREAALEAFRTAKTRVLVATDIAARGIDVDAVTHVINFELPEVPESYVHRIGRTARAGAAGSAVSLVDGDERPLLRDIERLTRQTIAAESRAGDPALSTDRASGHGAGERGRGAPRHGERDGAGRQGRDNRHRQAHPGAQRREEPRAGGPGRDRAGSDPRGSDRRDRDGRGTTGTARNGSGQGNGSRSTHDRRDAGHAAPRHSARRDDRPRGDGRLEPGGLSFMRPAGPRGGRDDGARQGRRPDRA